MRKLAKTSATSHRPRCIHFSVRRKPLAMKFPFFLDRFSMRKTALLDR
jgi:hypothetical protein